MELTKTNFPKNALASIIEYSISNLPFCKTTFNHFAMIYSSKGKTLKIYSYGYNHIRNNKSIHAEIDAINNLPNVTKKKKLVKVYLIVIRLTNKSNHGLKLQESKCCINCKETICDLPQKRGFYISIVSYSNKLGQIETKHPVSLLLEKQYYISKYFSKRNYFPKIRHNIIKNPNPKTKLFLLKRDYAELSSSDDSEEEFYL